MVAFAPPTMPDRERAALLLVALENAVEIIEASDTLLSMFDPKYDGVPVCIAEFKALVERCRVD